MVQMGGAELCVPETMASPGSETAGPGVCGPVFETCFLKVSVVNTGFCCALHLTQG